MEGPFECEADALEQLEVSTFGWLSTISPAPVRAFTAGLSVCRSPANIKSGSKRVPQHYRLYPVRTR